MPPNLTLPVFFPSSTEPKLMGMYIYIPLILNVRDQYVDGLHPCSALKH